MDAATINELLEGMPEELAAELRAKLELEGPLTREWCKHEPSCDYRCYTPATTSAPAGWSGTTCTASAAE